MKIIDTSNFEEARKIINKESGPKIVVAKDEKFNRKILEKGGFDVLLSIEENPEKISIRQISSGLNHVLARIAAKNKISIGIDLDKIKKLSKEQKGKRISKIRQNISICKKAGSNLYIIGDKKESLHFLLSLGASTAQAKKATSQCF